MPTHKTAAVNGESGFTLIDLLFTASLICLIATMAVPGLLRARGAAQSSSAVGTLRVVNSAQLSFAVTCGSGFYSPNFTTLGMMPPNSVTDPPCPAVMVPSLITAPGSVCVAEKR